MSILGISQLLLTQFGPNFMGRFLEPSLTDSNYKVTFFQEMYVPATFVHISIISAVTDPIWTKILEPNFWGLNFCGPTFFFEKKTSFDPNIFWTQNVCTEYFLLFWSKQICWTKKLVVPEIFWINIFFTLIIFGLHYRSERKQSFYK